MVQLIQCLFIGKLSLTLAERCIKMEKGIVYLTISG